MRSDVDHLPAAKQAELARIVAILHESFEERLRLATSARRRQGRIFKIVLFGSYARGDWVEDPKGGYFSDFDLLVIVNAAEFTDLATYWSAAEDRILRDKTVATVTNLIVHTLDEVNQALTRGQYFFSDIIEDGVMLYELKVNKPLAIPRPPDPQTAYRQAEKYFGFWQKKVQDSLAMHSAAISLERWNEAAFNLHQATERAYTAFLLTTKLYMPKTHNLNFLRSMAEDAERALIEAWPRGKRPYDRYFQLLKRAYTEARYSEHYKVTKDELAWLEDRVVALQGLVAAACAAHLARLRTAAGLG